MVWNQVKVPPCTDREHVTRVIQVEGPSEIVNEEFLLAYFRTKCRFDMEKILVLWEGYRYVKPRNGQLPAITSPVPAAPPASAPARRQGRALTSNNWRERAQPVTAGESQDAQAKCCRSYRTETGAETGRTALPDHGVLFRNRQGPGTSLSDVPGLGIQGERSVVPLW